MIVAQQRAESVAPAYHDIRLELGELYGAIRSEDRGAELARSLRIKVARSVGKSEGCLHHDPRHQRCEMLGGPSARLAIA